MTDTERLKALLQVREWMKDRDITLIVATVCAAEGQPHVGHLAHYCPEVFDLLHEEVGAMCGFG